MKDEIEKCHPKLINKDWKIINYNGELTIFNCFAYSLNIFNDWCGSSCENWHYEKIDRIPNKTNYIKYY